MAFLSLDTLNATTQVTDVHSQQSPFTGKVIVSSDSLPASAAPSQNIDGIRARGQLTGCGVLGEGGDDGAGVVGIAGRTYSTSLKQGPRRPPARHDMVNFNFPETAQRAGVFGRGRSQATFGVLGESEESVGVAGFSNNSIGVAGHAIDGHPGCAGIGEQGIGVIGQVITTQGQQPDPDSIAVWGLAASRMQSGTTQYFGHAGVFDGPVAVDGKLTVTGDFVVTGAKSAAVRQRDGSHRLLYCVESPESWFEDFGEGRLVKGRSSVRLEAAFASLIGGPKYHVFLTPYGDSLGLFVSRRSAQGFEVREQQNGRNNIEFSYRIVAKRRDVAGERLAKVKLAPRRTKSQMFALRELDRVRTGGR